MLRIFARQGTMQEQMLRSLRKFTAARSNDVSCQAHGVQRTQNAVFSTHHEQHHIGRTLKIRSERHAPANRYAPILALAQALVAGQRGGT